MPKSISRRIVISLAITTIVACVCEYGWLYLKARATALNLRQQSLLDQAAVIGGHIKIDRNGNAELNLPVRLAEAYDNSNSPYRYAVRNQYGNLIFTSGPSVGPLPSFNEEETGVYQYDPDGPGPALVVGAAVKATIEGHPYFVQVERVGREFGFLNAAVWEEFVADGGWLQLPFLFLLLGVGALAVRRAFKPLRKISRMAESIDPTKADVRLPVAEAPSEVQPLVHAINDALDRLDDGLRRQREFNANAAHQLRTPLAVLAAEIDGLPDDDAKQKLQTDVESMSRIVSQLLRLAQLETRSIEEDGTFDLNEVATKTAAHLGPMAIAAGKSLEVISSDSPVAMRGSDQVLATAVGNLIENAIAHTPHGATITIQVTNEPALTVSDDGHGIPQEWREKIFDRFWKADRESKGAGLGLAIVKRIVVALHGTVTLEESPSGGAQFKLSFDAAKGVN